MGVAVEMDREDGQASDWGSTIAQILHKLLRSCLPRSTDAPHYDSCQR